MCLSLSSTVSAEWLLAISSLMTSAYKSEVHTLLPLISQAATSPHDPLLTTCMVMPCVSTASCCNGGLLYCLHHYRGCCAGAPYHMMRTMMVAWRAAAAAGAAAEAGAATAGAVAGAASSAGRLSIHRQSLLMSQLTQQAAGGSCRPSWSSRWVAGLGRQGRGALMCLRVSSPDSVYETAVRGGSSAFYNTRQFVM